MIVDSYHVFYELRLGDEALGHWDGGSPLLPDLIPTSLQIYLCEEFVTISSKNIKVVAFFNKGTALVLDESKAV